MSTTENIRLIVRAPLNLNCLQRLSADDGSRKRVLKSHTAKIGFIIS